MEWDDRYISSPRSKRLRCHRIHRLHANQTAIPCYTLEQQDYDATLNLQTYTTSKEYYAEVGHSYGRHRGLVDLLEPDGYRKIIAHVMSARHGLDSHSMFVENNLQRVLHIDLGPLPVIFDPKALLPEQCVDPSAIAPPSIPSVANSEVDVSCSIPVLIWPLLMINSILALFWISKSIS